MPNEPSVPGELLGAREIRARAKAIGLQPTKQLGQNFVIDPNTISRIVREAELSSDDVVLEVGPGLGSLTIALVSKVTAVVAVEIDPLLAEALTETVRTQAPEYVDRLIVHHADALRVTELQPAPTALIANLPYNVSVPVLVHMFSTFPTLGRALVMVQREVGERIVATPGSKAYGVPSVKMQWFGTARLAGSIPRTVFWPEPNVDSVLVRIDRTAPPEGSRADVFALVEAAFGQRRKMMRRALTPAYGAPAAIEAALESIGVAGNARGEELSVTQFAELSERLPRTPTLAP
jgi:16S rRNA (adenine1518-N6/adenine1519-N6)-dimethyltransferase